MKQGQYTHMRAQARLRINQRKPHSPAWWVLPVPTFAQGKAKPKNLRDCRRLSLWVGLLCRRQSLGPQEPEGRGLPCQG